MRARNEQGRLDETGYRALVDKAPIVTYVRRLDRRGSTTYVSPRIRTLLGFSASEWCADPALFDERLHPEDRERVFSALASVREAGRSFRCEYRIRARDGETVWLRDEATVDVDELGELVAHGFLLDVTEERIADLTSRASEARLRMLTEQLPAVLWTTDRELELTSLAGSGLVGLDMDAAGFPGAKAEPALRRALEGESAGFSAEWGGRRFEAHVEPLKGEDGEPAGVIGVALDVTERVRAEAELRAREDELRQAQRLEALGRLAGGIAHDFNNLLTAISGNAHLLLESIPESDPTREEAESIRRTAERAAALVDQLLAVGRRTELHPMEIDLGAVVRDLDELIRRLLPSSIQLVVSLDPRLPHVRADPAQLEQVILNLAANARDAMPDGGTLVIETSTSDEPDSESESEPLWTVLTVADTGVGMDEESRLRIFEPFFTTKEAGAGTGLGLATVHGIVTQSGGRISVESEPGHGSAFRISLPIARSQRKHVPEASGPTPPPQQAKAILLVEDDDEVRTLTRKTLERRGYRILEAADGAAALEIAERQGRHVDLLVTDVVLPGLDGGSLARAVTRLRPALRTVFVSGYADDATLARLPLGEAATLLRKPFTPDQLIRAVRDALAAEPGDPDR